MIYIIDHYRLNILKNNFCINCASPSKGVRCGVCKRHPQCISCDNQVNHVLKKRCNTCNEKNTIKQCMSCNNIIFGKNGNKIYCSDQCIDISLKNRMFSKRVNKECNMCFRSLMGVYGHDYCGVECYDYYRKLYVSYHRYPNKPVELI